MSTKNSMKKKRNIFSSTLLILRKVIILIVSIILYVPMLVFEYIKYVRGYYQYNHYTFILRFSRYFQFQYMNWNDLSDDSWLKSSSQQQANEEAPNELKQQPVSQRLKQEEQGSNTASLKQVPPSQQKQNNQKPEQLSSQTHKNEKKAVVKQKRNDRGLKADQANKKPRKEYPTDQEILSMFQKDEVEQKNRLKVVNCIDEKQIQALKKMEENRKLKIRQYKQHCYVLKFVNKQSVIGFIKQKMEKGYKFKIGVYIASEKEKAWIAEKSKEREEQIERRKKQQQHHHKYQKPKQYKEKDEQQKQKQPYRHEKQIEKVYRQDKKEKVQQKKEKKQYNKNEKQNNKQKTDIKNKKKEEYKEKRNLQLINASFSRPNNYKGQVNINSNQAPPADFVWWLKNQKIPNQFNRIRINFNKNIIDYIEKVCDLCFFEINFVLQKSFTDLELENLAEMVVISIVQNKQNKVKQSPKLISYRFIQGIYIHKLGQEHFQNIEKYNTHVIGSKENLGQAVDFNEKQYIQLFKKNSEKIITTKQKWIIYAYGKNISKLLRLSGLFKKILAAKNKYEYEVGVFEGLPFARFQICHLNKNKSVDASVVNNYLRDS